MRGFQRRPFVRPTRRLPTSLKLLEILVRQIIVKPMKGGRQDKQYQADKRCQMRVRDFGLFQSDISLLDRDEVEELLGYCDIVLADPSLARKSRKAWHAYRSSLVNLLN